jgi:ESX secretion system ATPase EccB
MNRQPSKRLQVSAQRFSMRRMEHALVRKDVAMDDDPMRAQSRSLAAGCVLAAIAVAGCAILAVVKPHGAPGDAPIVMARESGAVYVRLGDTLHPVFNLVSAQLLARTSAKPVVVAEASIAEVKKGPMVGIPGAPAAIGEPLPQQTWSVCDDERTAVIVGVGLALDPSRIVLVTPRGESAATTYLLYDGWRAEVDLRDRAVVRALRLDGVVPLPVSRALLDTVPEAPAVVVPRIAGLGSPGPEVLGGFAVGTVVRVARADANEFYVVLVDGVQRIGDVAADVIRFAYRGPDEIPTLTPAAVAGVRTVATLPVDTFPRRASTPVGAKAGALVCAQWQRGEIDGRSSTTVLAGRPNALEGMRIAELAQADGDGPKVDAIALPGGRSADVRSTAFPRHRFGCRVRNSGRRGRDPAGLDRATSCSPLVDPGTASERTRAEHRCRVSPSRRAAAVVADPPRAPTRRWPAQHSRPRRRTPPCGCAGRPCRCPPIAQRMAPRCGPDPGLAPTRVPPTDPPRRSRRAGPIQREDGGPCARCAA